ncbi:MAG TPA: tetratricopeptide repeat protein [Bryobacteraceae bacterium]|nr:tetratricopeptide repeat protein [Bryobacteraceae bacterium]
MKLRSLALTFAGFVMFAASALAQITTIEGTVTGVDGKPVQGAIIKIHRTDIKWDAQLKTDKHGHYIHTGVPLGTFDVSVIIDGKEADVVHGVKSQMGDHPPTDFDLRKSTAANASKNAMVKQAMESGQISDDLRKELTPEQKAALEKSMAENKGKIQKQKALNDAFNEGLTALQAAPTQTTPEAKAEKYQEAVTALEKASTVDATQPAVWSNLGDAYLGLASTKTGADFDTDTAKGIEAYNKSIELKPDDPATHNNYGLALAKAKKYPEAEAELKKAAELDPATAFQRYYNLGALLTNIGQAEPASKAFKAAIDAAPDNPKNAASYYQYAISLVGQATVDKEGKFVTPPGTIEAFQKYLQLAPDGQYAQAAKETLTQLGGSIQTTYSNPNAPKKKK